MEKIWANSGDSHFNESPDLYAELAPDLAARLPRSVKDPDGQWETVYVDGESFRRKMPVTERKLGENGKTFNEAITEGAGIADLATRLSHLDQEGVWGEVVYPSLGLWNSRLKDPGLVREAIRVANDWTSSRLMEASGQRLVVPAAISNLSMDDTIAELQRAMKVGFKAVGVPTVPPEGVPPLNDPYWEPLWDFAEESNLVIAIHTGSAGKDPVVYHGPGAGIVNYYDSCYSGQIAIAQLVSSGALDRRPSLRVLLSEAGASWVPFLGDRLDESYRQHGPWVKPKLGRMPTEILYSQVYASFQHDRSSIPTLTAMGYQNVMFGSDYPHLEGTFGHTQETLHELFDDQPDDVTYRITRGAFLDLFPHVGEPPAVAGAAA